MKIHEYLAAKIFEEAGLPVPQGGLALNVDEAMAIAQKTGYPAVLKSQVLVGGRGKAGGIKIVKDEEDLKAKFAQLQKLVIKGYAVEKITVVEAVKYQKEYYTAITIDNAKDDVVMIASAAGGIEIEETAKTNPEAIKKCYLHGKKETDPKRWKEFINSVFESKKLQEDGTQVFQHLMKVFFENDCSLAEINPLVLTDEGEILALDAKINFDDNALYRHENIQKLLDLKYEDPDEIEAKESDLSFVKLDGNVGCIVNGAGLAMGTMDVIKIAGGNPANFLDVGGSSNPNKVLNALKIILRNKEIKVVLINIFGGITRCDDIANGILEAQKQLDLSVPLVIRLTGTNEDEGKEILTNNNINTFSNMRDAVNRAVEIANKGSR